MYRENVGALGNDIVRLQQERRQKEREDLEQWELEARREADNSMRMLTYVAVWGFVLVCAILVAIW